MTYTHEYPAAISATADDFNASGWRDLIRSVPLCYRQMRQPLLRGAISALEDQRPSQARILWLLSDICSYAIQEENKNDPYSAFAFFAGTRTAAPTDLSSDDLRLLGEILPLVDHPILQGRIADLLWNYSRPRRRVYAETAFQAFCTDPIDHSSWHLSARQNSVRACAIARQLNAPGPLKTIERRLLLALSTEPKVAVSVAEVLFTHRLASSKAGDIARILMRLGHECSAKARHGESRPYFESASQWFERSGEPELKADATMALSDAWAREAEARSSQPSGSSTAASFFEKAIQTLRTVPKQLRPGRGLDTRIANLHRMLRDAGLRSLTELVPISSGPIDLSAAIAEAQRAVAGKAPSDALRCLATIHPGFRRSELEKVVEDHFARFPLFGLFSKVARNREGRVIAKTGGRDADFETERWAESVIHYRRLVELVVSALILPALGAFLLDHRMSEAHLLQLALDSSVVPPGRERLFAKGLAAGFNRDFSIAIHVLAPQVENLVRWHLQCAGVNTTILGPDGVENEVGLSALITLPEAEQVLGVDLAFEIQALFCDKLGPNLRNLVAHGLLSSQDGEPAATIYAWWFVLRLLTSPFWNQAPAAHREEFEE